VDWCAPQGIDRAQSTLFPECLEDWIGEDNPVRVIDVLADELNLAELGTKKVENGLLFMPTNLTKGIDVSDDLILVARTEAYGQSYRRRKMNEYMRLLDRVSHNHPVTPCSRPLSLPIVVAKIGEWRGKIQNIP
jgi:hypothetical protein